MNRSSFSLAALTIALTTPALAQIPASELSPDYLSAFEWRSVGPANMSGRVTDVEGIGHPSKTFFFAAAAGGVWKTTNNGTTFRLVFGPDQPVISMGDLAIAPSDTQQVWAGTGEEDSRNSISPGGGIFKSADGGQTWEFKGLRETQVIARIRVHPSNPDRVYVAALGHIWDSNPERGIYRTDDGGQTWDLIKFVSERAGFVDLVMHPDNPDIMFASSWERVRGPWFLKSGGPGSALWKTTDGGDSWSEIQGNGFPETELGRIGLDISRSNPDIMYAIVEAAAPEEESDRLSGLYRSEDGGESWERMNSENTRPFYYSQVRVDPLDPDRVYWSSTPVRFSVDGGRTVGQTTIGIHVDHHAMWIDPADPEHFIVGNDGGVAQTWDRGGNYDYINTVALGQFYNVSYGMDTPYTVCGGLQDNGSWCGPSRLRQGTITNSDWAMVSGGDGFVTQQDPRDANIIYSESQGGNMGRLDFRTGERTTLQKPDWREGYRVIQDSMIVLRGDTTRPAPAGLRAELEGLQQQATADSARSEMRWNWNTPFFLSPHDPNVLYAAGNKVVKSDSMGEDLRVISGDLSRQEQEKIQVSLETTGGITPDATGAETYGTIVSLAESPVREGLLYAGTDDGRLWRSNQEGVWHELTGSLAGLPEDTYVSRIEPSHHTAERVYVTFDGHRTNDFTPYVYVSENAGDSFRSIASDLPRGNPDFVHVIREDPVNENLLFVGTDVGVYLSLDRGISWTRFMTGLPTVPVHDLKIHPREADLIAGTHGRSIWIVPIAALQQLTAEVIASDVHLFAPTVAAQFGQGPGGGGAPNGVGHKVWSGQNDGYGAVVSYYIADGSRSSRDRATISILDATGDTVTSMTGSGNTGLHTIRWNFQGRAPEPPPLSPSQVRDSIEQVRRQEFVVDSLKESGMEQSAVDRIERLLASRNRSAGRSGGGGGGGGGGTASREFQERPGENAGRERTGGEAAGGGANLGGLTLREVLRLVNPPGTAGQRSGLGNRPVAEPGEYTVILEVKDRTFTTTLTVQGT